MKQQVIDTLSKSLIEHFDEQFLSVLIDAIEDAPAALVASLEDGMRKERSEGE